MTQLVIQRVDNGYVLIDTGVRQVFEDAPLDEYGEVESLRSLLWAVVDVLGGGDRYGAKRIRITIEPGDKWVLRKPLTNAKL